MSEAPKLKIDYIEFGATDLEATKRFYQNTFGWTFTDYGPDYTSFDDGSGRLSGGFAKESPPGRSPLVVLYTSNLEETYRRVKDNGGEVSRDLFTFPGGRRFHFLDPNGNELAVWSDK